MRRSEVIKFGARVSYVVVEPMLGEAGGSCLERRAGKACNASDFVYNHNIKNQDLLGAYILYSDNGIVIWKSSSGEVNNLWPFMLFVVQLMCLNRSCCLCLEIV